MNEMNIVCEEIFLKELAPDLVPEYLKGFIKQHGGISYWVLNALYFSYDVYCNDNYKLRIHAKSKSSIRAILDVLSTSNHQEV